MNCPACDRGLTSTTLDDVTVDVRDGGCGGYWLDAVELEAIWQDVQHLQKSDGPIRVHVQKTPKPRNTASGGGNRIDRAVTLDSLYQMIGAKS